MSATCLLQERPLPVPSPETGNAGRGRDYAARGPPRRRKRPENRTSPPSTTRPIPTIHQRRNGPGDASASLRPVGCSSFNSDQSVTSGIRITAARAGGGFSGRGNPDAVTAGGVVLSTAGNCGAVAVATTAGPAATRRIVGGASERGRGGGGGVGFVSDPSSAASSR